MLARYMPKMLQWLHILHVEREIRGKAQRVTRSVQKLAE